MADGSYKTLNALMRHIRDDAGIAIGGSTDKKALAHVGYFHGYKGYRYSAQPNRRIPYSQFDELRAVIEFDTKLKALFYPILMRLEMTMKNLALVEVLDAAGSSSLRHIYSRIMPGTKNKRQSGKLEVIHSSNGALLKAYKRNNSIARHYYDSPLEAVPVWGLMEIITLGHFATFLEQIDDAVLGEVARSWGIHKNYGNLVPHLVFAVTDLRNAVAHNGIVFDTRFSTGRIRRQVKDLLVKEIGFTAPVRLEFNTVTDYVVLVVFLSCGMGFPKREIAGIAKQYAVLTDELHGRVPVRVFDMIVHTDNRAKITQLEQWARAH